MGNSASSEQDAVKKQAEGGSVPMYGLVDLKGKSCTSKQNENKFTFEIYENNEFYGFIIALATISILLQTIMGIMGVFIGVKDINDEQHQEKATTLNKVLLILGVITVVVNVLLASFSS